MKDLALLEQLLERVALDKFHPETDAAADLFRAVNGDDVRVTDFGEEPPFLNDRARGLLVRGRRGGQELQGNFAIEPRVEGAEDLAEGAVSDAFEQAQVTPVGGRLGRQDVALRFGDRRDEPQVP